MLRDQKWRDMRATLSPAFTGSKMRQMFRLIVECAQGAGDMLVAEARRSQSELGVPFVPELKDVFTRCMTDVIASTAFGLQVCVYLGYKTIIGVEHFDRGFDETTKF